MDHTQNNEDYPHKIDIISNLPYEIAIMIFQKLKGSDLLSASSVCRKWYEITNLDFLWKQACAYEGIEGVNLADSSQSVQQFFSNYSLYWKAVYARQKKIEDNWIKGKINSVILIPYKNLSIQKVYYMDDKYIILDYHSLSYIHVWSTTDQKLLHVFETGTGFPMVWSIYKEKLAISRVCSSKLNVWNFTTGQQLLSIRSPDQISSIRMSDTWIFAGCWSGFIRIHDANNGNLVNEYFNQATPVSCSDCDFDNNLLVWGGFDTTISMWNMTTNICMYTLRQHYGIIADVKFMDDYLVSCSADSQVCIWNKFQGTLMNIILGNLCPISILKNKRILTHTVWPISAIRIWDLVTGNCLLEIEENGKINKFCVNEKYVIVFIENTVRIWNRITGRKIRTFHILNSVISAITGVIVTDTKLLFLGVNKLPSIPNTVPKARNIIILCNFDV